MTPPKAIVIEDDYLIADVFTIAMEQAGFEVSKILSGLEALERLKVETPDLVILDIHMPIVSGMEILRLLQTDERLSRVRVAVITADVLAAKRLDGKVEHILVKPVGFYQVRDLGEKLRKQIMPASDT